REHAHMEIVKVQYRRQLSLRHQRAVDEAKLRNLDKLTADLRQTRPPDAVICLNKRPDEKTSAGSTEGATQFEEGPTLDKVRQVVFMEIGKIRGIDEAPLQFRAIVGCHLTILAGGHRAVGSAFRKRRLC